MSEPVFYDLTARRRITTIIRSRLTCAGFAVSIMPLCIGQSDWPLARRFSLSKRFLPNFRAGQPAFFFASAVVYRLDHADDAGEIRTMGGIIRNYGVGSSGEGAPDFSPGDNEDSEGGSSGSGWRGGNPQRSQGSTGSGYRAVQAPNRPK